MLVFFSNLLKVVLVDNTNIQSNIVIFILFALAFY